MYLENAALVLMWILIVCFVEANYLLYAVIYAWMLTVVVLIKDIVDILSKNKGD